MIYQGVLKRFSIWTPVTIVPGHTIESVPNLGTQSIYIELRDWGAGRGVSSPNLSYPWSMAAAMLFHMAALPFPTRWPASAHT